MKTLTARRVRKARRIIAADRCPETGIRHRWGPMNGLSGAGLFVRCRNCGDIA